MDLKGIISISGKAGLYKVVAQGRNNIIVSALGDNRKFPIFSTDKVSALEDISIYTYEEDLPLIDVYEKLATHESYKPSINHKANGQELRNRIEKFLPNYDQERVYDTDLRKLFQWYNILIDQNIINAEAATASEEE
ncbi:hypothetical protein DNU06_08200 [Putridiphycobacter roseus]|uniref:Uncharacterized protein n=1 Tax=Putridiphycobacter roseus TaxID=2219161 RepID=A0A2W1NCW4_9FLAO|nr:DUF5606 domain-containing protein [Putridiphycobacter roseus]PZE17245.1 hypothetical protein DNU06_08200 [Putridiphycobacter roseus]